MKCVALIIDLTERGRKGVEWTVTQTEAGGRALVNPEGFKLRNFEKLNIFFNFFLL
jgi:hypothetical protein